MATKTFTIDDILTVTTGRLISRRHIDSVYDLCGFMLHEQLFTHQLSRACKECLPELARQLPHIAANSTLDGIVNDACDAIPEGDREAGNAAIAALVEKLIERCGEFHEVHDMPANEDGPRDPIQELADMVGSDKVVVVNPQVE